MRYLFIIVLFFTLLSSNDELNILLKNAKNDNVQAKMNLANYYAQNKDYKNATILFK